LDYLKFRYVTIVRVGANGTWIDVCIIFIWWVKPENKLICLKVKKADTGLKAINLFVSNNIIYDFPIFITI